MEARFSVQPRPRPRANTACCTVGTVSLLWVKRPRRGVEHPPPYGAECKERVELYLFFHSGPSLTAIGRTLDLITVLFPPCKYNQCVFFSNVWLLSYVTAINSDAQFFCKLHLVPVTILILRSYTFN